MNCIGSTSICVGLPCNKLALQMELSLLDNRKGCDIASKSASVEEDICIGDGSTPHPRAHLDASTAATNACTNGLLGITHFKWNLLRLASTSLIILPLMDRKNALEPKSIAS